jgi:hypothetical protein
MIKGITGLRHVVVSGANPSYPYISPGAASAGMLRFHNNEFQVYDGNTWMRVADSHPMIDLSPAANEALEWAMEKRQQELEMEKLAENHPAVAIALENLNKAKDQLKATIILSKDYEKSTS